MIRGIVVRENGAAIEEFDESFIPDGDVLVDVAWSDLNFKDGLAVTGRPGVVRTTPLVAGIDLVGTVVESTSPRWAVGDAMILNGAGLSETKHGGYATQARVDGALKAGRPPRLEPEYLTYAVDHDGDLQIIKPDGEAFTVTNENAARLVSFLCMSATAILSKALAQQ